LYQKIDILATLSDITPQNTFLNISLPYQNFTTIPLSENVGILLPATDLRRTVGMYHFRVTPHMGSIQSLDFSPISFTLKVTVASPSWIPREPDNAWTNLDFISFTIVFVISLTLTLIMTVLIVRARRRLLTMRNWQNRTEYAEEVSSYTPELYSVVMSIPHFNSLKIPGKDLLFGTSEVSIGSQGKYKDNGGWFKSLPNLIRRLTTSQMDIHSPGKTIYVNISFSNL
jgi:hypothetical protein